MLEGELSVINPQYLGYFAMLVSGVTIAARLRSIAKKDA
jgi:hypothetical protein